MDRGGFPSFNLNASTFECIFFFLGHAKIAPNHSWLYCLMKTIFFDEHVREESLLPTMFITDLYKIALLRE